MTQEPDCVIEESQLREILLKAYQLKCDELAHQRQVTEDAEVRLMAMNARLAAQSGYAEDEELAALREDKARLDWLDKRFESFEEWGMVWLRDSPSADLRKVIDEAMGDR